MSNWNGSLDQQSARLAILNEGGLIEDNRVAVNDRLVSSRQVGVLTAYPGEWRETERAVFVHGVAEVPPGVLAIGRDLAESLQLHLSAPAWRLRGGVPHVAVEEIGILITGDRLLEEVVTELNESENLAGQLLWCRDSDVPSVGLRLAGQSYQLSKLTPKPPATGVIMEITPSTRVLVRAPGTTQGVDMVILADVSGSMSYDDMTGVEGPTLGTRIRRDEALRQALEQLLRLRTETSGRLSRVALVSFSTTSTPLFPADGMQEIDETSPEEVITRFRKAISRVWATSGGTDIPQALNYAGQLLRDHDRGNEKLIVLISDGAHWTAKGDKATGEVIAGDADPVALMVSMYRASGIRLHAIGISSEAMFDNWCRVTNNRYSPEDRLKICPNHALLQRLVKVTEGDPATMGDTHELTRYFSGLGEGMERRLRTLRAAPMPSLQQAEREELSRLAPAPTRLAAAAQTRRQELRQQLLQLYTECNNLTARVGGPMLFNENGLGHHPFYTAIQHDVTREADFFDVFCQQLNRGTFENAARHAEKWVGKPGQNDPVNRYPYPDLVRLFRSARVQQLAGLLRREQGPATAATIERLLGRPGLVRSDDGASWAELQLKVLEETKAIFEEVLNVLTTASLNAVSTPTAGPGQTQPVGSTPAEPGIILMD